MAAEKVFSAAVPTRKLTPPREMLYPLLPLAVFVMTIATV